MCGKKHSVSCGACEQPPSRMFTGIDVFWLLICILGIGLLFWWSVK